jgi:hypothetical protein
LTKKQMAKRYVIDMKKSFPVNWFIDYFELDRYSRIRVRSSFSWSALK